MDLQKLRIEGRSINSQSTCNVILHFECVEHYHDDLMNGASNYCVLHRVQLEPTADSTFTINVPLDDSDVREHFEQLLSANYFGYDVKTGVAA